MKTYWNCEDLHLVKVYIYEKSFQALGTEIVTLQNTKRILV